MANTFTLTVRTPDEKVFHSTAVESIKVVTDNGPMIIYAHYASLTTNVLFSRLVVKQKDLEETFLLRRGTVFIDNRKNSVMILALACQKSEVISFQDAKQYLAHLEEKLAKGENFKGMELKYLQEEKFAIHQQVEIMEKEKVRS